MDYSHIAKDEFTIYEMAVIAQRMRSLIRSLKLDSRETNSLLKAMRATFKSRARS